MGKALPISGWFEHVRGLGLTSATLLGKGPSLDWYKPVPGAFVMGINDVPTHHRCDCVVYVDKQYNEFEYPEGVTILRPADRENGQGGSGYAWHIYQPGNPETDDYLRPTGEGTGTKALQILGMAGFTDIMLWGFEGMLCTRRADAFENQPLGKNYHNIGLAMRKAMLIEGSSIQRVTHGVPPGPVTIMEPADG